MSKSTGNLVTIENKKVIVKGLSAAELKRILEARLVLEGYAAERAALIRSEEMLERLEELVQRMEEAEDGGRFLELSTEFIFTIYREIDNPTIEYLIEYLINHSAPYMLNLHVTVREKGPILLGYYRRILEALRNRDPAGARRWLTEDLEEVTRMTIERIEGGAEKP